MKSFNIPNIKDSLKMDYLAGNISIYQEAKEAEQYNIEQTK